MGALNAVAVLCFLAFACSPAHALKLSNSPIDQFNVQILLTSQVVQVHPKQVVDASASSVCTTEPQVFSVVNGAYMGTPPTKLDFVLRTDTAAFIPPGNPYDTSQTFYTDGPTCSSPSREVVYIGNGMFWHQLAEPFSAVPVRGMGVLGLGFDAQGGTWTTPNGWTTANMFFGNERSFGWVVLNTTEHHPFAVPGMDPRTLQRVPLTSQGVMILHNSTLRIVHGDNTVENIGVDVEFLPEYRFIDLPPVLFERILVHPGVNVHDAASMEAIPQLSIHMSGVGWVSIHRQDMTVTRSNDVSGVASRFLAIRKGAYHNRVRIGCAMTQLSVFWDGSSFQPNPDPNSNSDKGGSVLASFAPVAHVERLSVFNTCAFLVLSLCFLVWLLVTTATNMHVVPSPQEEWEAKIAFISEFFWWKEGVEVLGSATAVVSTWINYHHLHLYERYIHFTGSFNPEWNHNLTTWLVWITMGHGILLFLVLCMEASPCFRPLRRRRTHSHFNPLKHSAHDRCAQFTWCTRCTRGRSGLVVVSMAAGDAKENVVGHVQVWYFYIMIRHTLFIVSVFLGLAITRIEGPPSGGALLVVLFVSFMMILFQTTKISELLRALIWEWRAKRPACSNMSNRLQVVFVLCDNLLVAMFTSVFFLTPTISNVLWEITWVPDWAITMLAVGWVITSAVGITAHRTFSNPVTSMGS